MRSSLTRRTFLGMAAGAAVAGALPRQLVEMGAGVTPAGSLDTLCTTGWDGTCEVGDMLFILTTGVWRMDRHGKYSRLSRESEPKTINLLDWNVADHSSLCMGIDRTRK